MILMILTDIDYSEFHPVLQQKNAQNMLLNRNCVKIQFVLTTPTETVPCQWENPFIGSFMKIGDSGVFFIDQLPADSLIIGQKYVNLLNNEIPCKFCNNLGARCPGDPLCDTYTQYTKRVTT